MARLSLCVGCCSRWGRGARAWVSLLLIGCVLLSGWQVVLAQAGDVTVSVAEVDATALPSAAIRVGVLDQNGVPIPDLTAEHFEIVEDGAAVFVPTSVQVEESPQAQVSLAVVIDLYRTLRGEPILAAQQATQDLLADLLDQPDDRDRAAFVGVRQGVSTDPAEIDEEYEVAFTNDRNRLLNVINFLHERIQSGGPGTPLYDAVIKAVRMAEASEPVAHRAVVVMTDGEDRGSIHTDSDTIQRASNARTPVFAVGLSNAGLDEAYLRRLAESSGGTYQRAETPDDLASSFAAVLSMLRQQYVLSYESGLPQDGQAHSVLVRVRTPTGLEGFQEYRVVAPGGVPEEGQSEEEAAPTAQAETLEPVVESEPGADEEGGLAAVRDWVQDNLLLAGLAAGGLGLLFLVVLVGVIFVMRRRRADHEEGDQRLEIPSYPAAPEADYEPEPWGGFGESDEVAFQAARTAEPPSPTLMDEDGPGRTADAGDGWADGQPFAPWSPPRYEEPPTADPGFRGAGYDSSSADHTRILQQRPKITTVGLLIDRDQPNRRLDLAQPVISIGRSKESDVVVDHGTVSRQHAVIKLEDKQFRLYDLGSTNGTFVDGDEVSEPVTLEDGAVVTFGEKAFVFKLIALGT